MKVIIKFSVDKILFKDRNTCDGLSEVFAGDPDGVNFYDGAFEKNSPVLAEIFNRLSVLGLKPWRNHNRPRLPNEFTIIEEVKYVRKDFEKASYLLWFANHSLGAVAVAPFDGQIILNLDPLDLDEVEPRTRKALFAGDLHLADAKDETLVSTTFRNIIDHEHLIGVVFEDRVRLIGEQADNVPEKYWVLRSNLVLPPRSKQTRWVNEEGEPCGPDTPGSCLPLGEHFRYDASALAPMEPFDLALVRECKPPARATLISQRFYQLCLKHKIPLWVEPTEVVAD